MDASETSRNDSTFAMCKRRIVEIYHEVRTALIAHGSLTGEYYPQGVALGYPIMPRWGGRPAV